MKWLLILFSFNLYAQYDPREYITSVASDPVADTNIIKNLNINDVSFYYQSESGVASENTKAIDASSLEINFPESVNSSPQPVITPWYNYDATTFYFLDGGVPVMNFTVPSAPTPPYPPTVPWGLNDIITFRLVYTTPQLQSAVDQAAIESRIVVFEDPSFDVNNGEPIYTTVLVKMKVRLAGGTTWMETIAGYPTFYGLNVTGFADYPANTIPNDFACYALQWDVVDYKSVDNKELINLLINVVKNNISRLEALEAP